MNCHKCQTWISEAFDGNADEPLRPEAEQHRAACDACQNFERTLLALEPHLKRQANHPVLPDDFVSTVMLRSAAVPKRLSAEEAAQLRVQFEREHRQALALLKHRLWPWQLRTALLQIGILGAVVVVAWFVLPRAEFILLSLTSGSSRLSGVNGSLAIALVVALAAVIWDWKQFGARSRLRRRFQTMLRAVRV